MTWLIMSDEEKKRLRRKLTRALPAVLGVLIILLLVSFLVYVSKLWITLTHLGD
ncbi:MAG: hypothetical protein HQL77_00690 [Magnetococcales bacterium]|nr:hypothetical protein [Magnetococcales bacterium]